MIMEVRRGLVDAAKLWNIETVEDLIPADGLERRRIGQDRSRITRLEDHTCAVRQVDGEPLRREVEVGPLDRAGMDWQSRAHFFAAVAREMRHIVVDYARARDAKKRPDGRLAISLTGVDVIATEGEEDLLALDEALSRLESIDPRASRVVELRYFTGLSEREAAEALGVSISTLKRDWAFARAWLLKQLGPGAGS